MVQTKKFSVVRVKGLKELFIYAAALMPPANNQEYDVHLASAVRSLTDLRQQLVTGECGRKGTYLTCKAKMQ